MLGHTDCIVQAELPAHASAFSCIYESRLIVPEDCNIYFATAEHTPESLDQQNSATTHHQVPMFKVGNQTGTRHSSILSSETPYRRSASTQLSEHQQSLLNDDQVHNRWWGGGGGGGVFEKDPYQCQSLLTTQDGIRGVRGAVI